MSGDCFDHCQGHPAPALTAVLDELDEMRAKATQGPWEVRWQCPEESHHHDWDEGWIADPEGATVAVVQERYTSAPADAALIVGAVNRLPQLTAALRAVLDLADDWDRNAAIFPEYGDLSAAAARSIRTAITEALEATP